MQIYVLGGSPCSGKSSIAERLAAEYSLNYYKIDDYEQAHCQRCTAKQQPVLFRYLQLSWNERWMRPVELQVEEEFAIARERWLLRLRPALARVAALSRRSQRFARAGLGMARSEFSSSLSGS